MKHLLFTILLFISIYVGGQTTVSPYSIFGPGELQNKGFSRSSSMGGSGIALKSGNNLNNINPASYTGIDSLRLIFEFGVKGKYYDLSSSGESNTGYTGNFNYMALGWRYTNWFAGSIGVVPFSSVGYSVSKTNYVEGKNEQFISEYVGSGGISQAYFGNAIKINKNLSIGINASYLFGSLTQEENLIATGVVPSYQIVRQDFLKSFYFDYGIQYSFPVRKWNYSLGVTFSNQQNLKSSHFLKVYDASYNLVDYDEYDSDHLKVPTKIGIGIGIQNSDRLTFLADYNFQKWSDVEYPIQLNEFKDSHRFSVGSEFRLWEYRITNRGYKNWIYRLGLNYETSYLSFGSKTISSKGVSFGAGVPIPGRISNVNWGVEIGSNGTLSNQLIKENYILFHLGFSLNEIAFLKRRYD
ncbi:hypothetical protein GM418_18880 [Maribellus comscasis]|uniref:Long-chain fatty acid transport protein n=1 Tax=Maribellus comscasis TaxID=2681766 RepID=A0A6I6JWF9_9BACT|nr:hypothetical protein [Maribellus comscasis]QGY45659.1 hypothetical protein GM418_18880 [Maribellus comscasis]